ncbi:hypothetical protein J2S54_002436 [Streptomyces sp. DSM 42143]|uniref:hypothetical protein n=1 Tax=Streptomyces sp. DSM 42143 TaxID=2817711 RepID=UPI00278B2AED|nr:hypothetical protein [Streptomyces sp. DSM 42143]MDQ0385616.1 hypothetical protein [Streptomyces sp. DSM 42143]
MRNRTTRAGKRNHRRRPPAAALIAALTATLSLTACGSPNPTDETDKASAATQDRPSPSRATPQSPTATPEPSVSAADGDDIRACADGNCEVAVTKPVTVRFQGPGGAVTLSVTEVGQNKIEYTVKSGNGQAKGGTSGQGRGCVTAIRENGSGTSCGGAGRTRPSPQSDAVVIQASTGPDATALLHVVSP